MESKFHRWWLAACFAGLLLASWAGGFSAAVTSVFIVIYLTGVALIGPDDEVREPVDVVAADPVDVEPPPVEAAPAAEPAPAGTAGKTESEDTDTAGETESEDAEDDAVPYPEDTDEATDATDAEAGKAAPVIGTVANSGSAR